MLTLEPASDISKTLTSPYFPTRGRSIISTAYAGDFSIPLFCSESTYEGENIFYRGQTEKKTRKE